MKLNRVMIAAPKSGSGKTMITCALLQALKDKGKRVFSYKCGPDYIDPMFHEKVIGIPSKNLDTFFTAESMTRSLFLAGAEEGGLAVLEGVMGLFDGLGGICEEGSSYHLAKTTKTPIVLVVDAKGMSRSVIPLLAGFLAYDNERLIRGVILNRTSRKQYETLKPLIEEELEITVLGFMPQNDRFRMESRHLGLVKPDELEDIQERLQSLSDVFQKTVSVEGIMEIAGSAEGIDAAEKMGRPEIMARQERPVIAVAKDEAFCFYYADNLQLLEEYGAQIAYFSPLYDERIPDGCHALLIGGGYPELYAQRLGGNISMRHSVKEAAQSGMPVVAECGGFLYLHSTLTDKRGKSYDMAGVIAAACFDTGKLVRFGYVEMQEKQSFFLPEGEKIKGHEFHYYDSTDNGNGVLAVKPMTGKEYSCMIESETIFAGFPHLYYPSNPAFAKIFVEKAKKYMQKNELAKEKRT